MPWENILRALETGKMKPIGDTLSAPERVSIAKYLGVESEDSIPKSAYCSAPAASPAKFSGTWSTWGIDSSNSRFQTAEAAGLKKEDVPHLKLKWAFGFPGVTTSFGSPTVSGGRLFVGSADGTVYSLDATTGCIYWTYKASEGVRTAVVIDSDGRTAYFGDLHGYVHAVDAKTGAKLWQTRVDDHPLAVVTGTPVLEAGRLYVPLSGGEEEVSAGNPSVACCKFRGSIVALDAHDGKQLWKTFTIAEPAAMTGRTSAGTEVWGPAGVSVWSTPTVDRQSGLLYAGTGVNYTPPATKNSDAVLAFDMATGQITWSQQFIPDDVFNFGCQSMQRANCPEVHGKNWDIGFPPMLKTLVGGRRLLIVGQKSGVVHALDPDKNGKIVWENKIAKGGTQGGIIWGGASDDALAYFSVSDWDPANPEAGGGVFALDIATGKTVWSTPAPKPTCLEMKGCSAAQPGAVSVIPGVVFAGSLDGHLRAYDTANGAIIWDFDTVRNFKAVDGVRAHGGSMNGNGPIIAGGMVYSNSGYSRMPVMPGNVLLAFSAGK